VDKKRFSLIMSKVGLLIMMIALFVSCSTTQKLTEDQLILRKNVLKIITEDDRVNTKKITQELTNLLKQTPQRKSILNPRTYGKKRTVYDEKLTQETAEEFQKYLRNRKGFYKADVSFQSSAKHPNVTAVYNINIGDRHYISSIITESKDSTLVSLLESRGPHLFEVGDPLDGSMFDREKLRLVKIAKDNGYADFNGNYIEFRGDSSNIQTDVIIYIYPPISKKKHTAFKIGEINVYTEHLATNEPYYYREDTLDDQSYFSKSQNFVIDPFIINKILPLKSGNVYSREREDQATKNLTSLSPYKFITINNYKTNPTDSVYNYNIFLTPHENKWAFNMGGDLFFSLLNSSQITNEDLVGIAGNIGYENRNFKNRAIQHTFGMEATVEYEVPSFRPNTLGLQLNNSFQIPGIVDIFNTGSFFNKVGLLTDASYKNLDLNGNTRLDLNAGFTSILQFYDLNTVNVSWTYTFQPNIYARYSLTQLGINILDTKLKEDFLKILENNQLLAQSFKPYLMTGFLFRELNISRRSREKSNGSYFTYLGSFELSGFENFVINKAVNAVSNYNERWSIGSLDLSEFLKINNELRFNLPVLKRSSFAARVNAGIVFPYGGLTNDGLKPVVPYVKQYYVGGPNSLRGWQIRELGPGSYNHDREPGEPFFQAGNLKFELNAEYRFDLFYIFEGAFFLDMGNVWTLREDSNRPGAKISSNFLNEMAMSTGWGFRIDLDYFLFRFDFGYKLRLPYPDPNREGRFVLTDGNHNGYLGNVNFAINYPF
jgi:outer membrane protein insertion porin family